MAESGGTPAVAYVVERKRNDGTTRFLACYRDPEGRVRSAGTHATRRAAERAAHREEQKVLAGSWRDAALGAVSFRDYVENSWLPSKHIEPTTAAAYVSHLNRHFYPFFGRQPRARYPTDPVSGTRGPQPTHSRERSLHTVELSGRPRTAWRARACVRRLPRPARVCAEQEWSSARRRAPAPPL